MLARAVLLAWVIVNLPAMAQDDLRARYGTRGLEAAQRIDRGLTLLESKDAAGALVQFDAAIVEEPDCSMAHFQRALALGDLGRVDEAIAAYEHTFAISAGEVSNIRSQAAINLGLLYVHLEDWTRSNLWLTRAILSDPRNEFDAQTTGYRNMAVAALRREEYFTAAMCAASAHRINPGRVGEDMIKAATDRMTDREEVARTLTLEMPDCDISTRGVTTRLTEQELVDGGPSDEIMGLLPHCHQSRLFAFGERKPHYFIVELGETPAWREIAVDGFIHRWALADDELFLAMTDPIRLLRIDAVTGKIKREYPLDWPVPFGLAVLPSVEEAYLAADENLRIVDLATGRTRISETPSLGVCTDPQRGLLYCQHHDRATNRSRSLIVGGQILFLHSLQSDMLQTELFQYKPAPAGLLLSWVRVNAASNGRGLTLSPDGRWVAVVGGGGWRPADGQRGGYGVAVLCASDPSDVRGYFPTDSKSMPYPTGCAINGVTDQIVVMSENQAAIYHLADEKESVKVAGKFTGACAWSADGAWLALATKGGGIQLRANDLTDEEVERARQTPPATSEAASLAEAVTPPVAVEALAELALFVPDIDTAGARATLRNALTHGRKERLPEWRSSEAFAADLPIIDRLFASVPERETGVRIYRLRQALVEHPDSLPLRYELADALRRSNQFDPAIAPLMEVIHGDAGRTDLSIAALVALADIRASRSDTAGAVHALATALRADLYSAVPRSALRAVLEKAGWDEAGLLDEDVGTVAKAPVVVEWRPLDPPAEVTVYDAAGIYQHAAASIVRVETEEGTGSGFCIAAPDIVLTNAHVVGSHDRVNVTTFTLREQRAERGASVVAHVILRSAEDDLAVLRLRSDDVALTPLPIGLRNPAVGQRIYALGHPVAGDTVLEETLTDGLISAVGRELDERKYLQHSAPVHGGSSGGPLLDERGVVVGVVTLRSELQGVSLAIPAKDIRQLLEKNGH